MTCNTCGQVMGVLAKDIHQDATVSVRIAWCPWCGTIRQVHWLLGRSIWSKPHIVDRAQTVVDTVANVAARAARAATAARECWLPPKDK